MKEKLKQTETDALNKCYSASVMGARCYNEDAMRDMYQKGADMMKGFLLAKLKHIMELKSIGMIDESDVELKVLVNELGK